MAFGDKKSKISAEDVNEKVMDIHDQMVEDREKNKKQFETIIGMLAKNRPVSSNKYIESEELDQGSDPVAEPVYTGEGADIVMKNVGDIESPRAQEKMALLKFYEEMVNIHVQEDNTENPMPRFPISINGKTWVFEPGNDYTVPRYVVEGFLRARPVHYKNVEYVDPADGVKKVKWPSRRGLRFPIALKSNLQKDHDWFNRIAREQ